MAPARAEDLDQLAAKLGRPPTALPAFGRLTAEQIGLLSDLIDAACERERRAVQAGLERVFPRATRRPFVRVMRGRPR